MQQTRIERQYERLCAETAQMKQDLQDGVVQDLRARLLLRHRLLLLSGDVFEALMIQKSAERLRNLRSRGPEVSASAAAKGHFTFSACLSGADAELVRAVKRDIVRMAKDAAAADIAVLACAAQELAAARAFFREGIEDLRQRLAAQERRFRSEAAIH